ncbi:Gfo/Idh/MocA family protein [Polymorphospora lycopeni]|uniref:Gfo/Idh/MocA family oxidoreductase n=1 Tax=Polymorphospora lycopeni TaxID=3140240 RepID=A0ABV5CQE2_9ACTN
MKVAVIGVGYWGAKLLRNLVRLLGPDRVVVADSDPDRLVRLRQQYPSVPAVPDLSAALRHRDVRAVVIATPVSTHARLTAEALHAGRHVLVEKPLAVSAARAHALSELARRHGLVLMVGHTFLFSPRVRWIAGELAAGGLGQLQYLTSSRLNLGPYRDDADVIWDLAPHDVSIALHLLKEMPESVHATARSVVRAGAPDVAFLEMTFPSGVLASVTVSWLAPRKTRTLTIVGDRKMLVYDDMAAEEPVKVYDKGLTPDHATGSGASGMACRHGDTVAPRIPGYEPMAEQLDHFLGCVRGGGRPESDGAFATSVVAVLEAADRSWREGGRRVPVGPGPAGVLARRGVQAPTVGSYTEAVP